MDEEIDNLQHVQLQIKETKISGAVGTYTGGLSPQLEEKALRILGLQPARISKQIILRSRHAHVINALAVLAGVLENTALNIRLLGQTEIGEVQEPFSKKQKGSSRMPHKKNTILTENLCGLARVIRSNAAVALENIATWGGRDISHSSTERIIFADCFQLTHFMIRRLYKVINGLVVNEKRMKENLEISQGVIFSPEVKTFLMDQGFSQKKAYEIAQKGAFKAIKEQISYQRALKEMNKIPKDVYRKMIKENISGIATNKLRYLDEIYDDRFRKYLYPRF